MKPALQFLFKHFKPYKWNVLQNVIFNFLHSFLSLVSFASIIPFLRILFDQNPEVVATETAPAFTWSSDSWMEWLNYHINLFIQENSKMDALMWVCVFIGVSFLLKNFFRYWAMYHMAPVRMGVVRDLRAQIHHRLLKLPLGYFSEEKKGNLIGKFTSDVTEVEFSIMSSLELVFKEPITFIIYLVSMFVMNTQLTLFVLVLLPISGIFISLIAKSLKSVANRGQSKLGEVVAMLEESLSGLRVLKSFGAEERRQKQFDIRNDHFFNIMTRLYRKQYLASPLSEFLGTLSMIAVLWFGGSQILDGSSIFDGAMFITYIIIFSQIITPAKKFSDAYFKLKKGMASVDRINEILDATPEPLYENATEEVKEFKGEISFKNVSFGYTPTTKAVNNVSFDVKKGEKIALVGTSGSGKTTIANLLPAFYAIQEGDIQIDGVSIRNIKMESLRSLFGIVTQESVLFNDTVSNNMRLWNGETDDNKVWEALKIAHAQHFVKEEDEGLEYVAGDGGSKFSGGQKQRMSIARAVYQNPPILILDEATSALDSESEKEVQTALNNLMKDRTAIVIAHRLATIQNADKIIVMEKGQIVEMGKHDDLITQKGAYWNFYQLQNFE